VLWLGWLFVCLSHNILSVFRSKSVFNAKDVERLMTMTTAEQSPDFNSIKRVNSLGNDYWSARELMPLLGYKNSWQNFEKVIKKAMVACQDLGDPIEVHFYPAEKEVKQGRATRKITDYFLSRHACYLTAQNGDPEKPQIRAAQNFFAYTARVYDLQQQLEAGTGQFRNMEQVRREHEQRLALRLKVSEENTHLFATALQSGVKSENMGLFEDAGIVGLYGKTTEELHEFWQLDKNTKIFNVMGREGLAANLLRITATDEKLIRENVQDENKAMLTHHDVGREVRKAVEQIHQQAPEDLPRAADLRKDLEARRRKNKKLQNKQKQIEEDGQGTLF
jgi:DNA-damage-inducible protein D